MGFQIVGNIPESDTLWVPCDATTGGNLYVGQLVRFGLTAFNGAAPLADAAGAADTTTAATNSIAGVVIGDNNFNQTSVATYGQYQTCAGTQTQTLQLARNFLGVEGITYIKGDPQPFVKIALITPLTRLRGPICNATFGVAPTVCTVTTAGATGAGFVGNAVDVTPVANMCTCYFRTGLNAGLYRVCKDANATTHTFDTYYPYAIAVGDTCVILPYKIGYSAININTTSNYVGVCLDCSVTPATDYFGAFVDALDFRVSGKESIYFRFAANHFAGI
jgi:hypothetical protein